MTRLPPTEALLMIRLEQAQRRRRSEIQELVEGGRQGEGGTLPSDVVVRLLGRPAKGHPIRVHGHAHAALALDAEG